MSSELICYKIPCLCFPVSPTWTAVWLPEEDQTPLRPGGDREGEMEEGRRRRRRDHIREGGLHEEMREGGTRAWRSGGVEEQLLSAAPLRTSVHATGTSHWLILQRSSCLKHKAHTNAHSNTFTAPAVIYTLQRSITLWTHKTSPFCNSVLRWPRFIFQSFVQLYSGKHVKPTNPSVLTFGSYWVHT